MDVNHSYMKPRDYKEISLNNREIKLFTIEHNSLWFFCMYDEKQDIAWRHAYMDYQAAYSDFVTFSKIFEFKEPASSILFNLFNRKRG